ncbi:MAG: UDP-N-acetylmuramoyl-L-alanyl-D-glutamate--2,6-diaminopimelate ligase [Lachnospiraceae bacterium]|nr:UDP-N-acetylmuramoyl-L-alanyl-D-glutamate--2,6-diaminopimelate ligase [Lachnospiraceae bacterium]
MQLSEYLKELSYEIVQGAVDVEVTGLVTDNRRITAGSLFVCIAGANFDGHSAAKEAAEKGAVALIVEKDVDTDQNVTVIKVDSTRRALAYLSAAHFGYPAREMKVIGVTGTKGKTTTTYLIRSILEHAGYRVGLIGTIEVIIGDEHIPAKNTTPESITIQEYFRKMADAGMQAVVMEVSSQGLMMHRTDAIDFDLGIFTNIEPDHIGPGEHDSFEHYLHCKSLLFSQCKTGIVNADDPHVEEVLKGHTCSVETYGLSETASLRAENIELVKKPGYLGVDFDVTGLTSLHVSIPTPGKFSVYNALCAVAVCRHFDIAGEDVIKALAAAKVKGRIEMIPVSDRFTLMIDYAHNGMALRSLLETLREYEPKRLVCVFGCGGNRSKDRRYEMGEVSGEYADLSIITSDNPRFEDPQAIIDDIKIGIGKTDGEYVEIIDRKEAIAYAMRNALDGDVIVLAGKGHEDYQEIRGVKHPMDERVLIEEILNEGI